MAQEPVKFCKDILSDVSRSFALTIPMLDDRIYKPIMITYLQDRLLDNFEDEGDISLERRKYFLDRVVEIFDPSNSSPDGVVQEIEEHAYLIPEESLARLTENSHLLRAANETLELEVRKLSFKWMLKMKEGMKKYLKKDIKTFTELDEYCYYVAGTVGGFLTDVILFKSNINTEDKNILLSKYNDAGLFLQKVNLIRDIKKDIRERNKNFWPLKSLNLTEDMLLNRDYKLEVMRGLNNMLNNIKEHIQGLVDYMEALPEEFSGYRRFFAVNNALGLATLEKMEDNPDVFYGTRKVKVSKIDFLRIISSPYKMFHKKAHSYL